MKDIILKFNYIVFSVFILCLMNSCDTSGVNQEEHSEHEAVGHTEEEHHHDEEAVIVSLTEKQIETVDIQFGHIENKELTATLKANGTLTVPNSKKAYATSLYEGIVKSLQVRVGEKVKKGELIARIANLDFIQLQEDYLTLQSRVALAEQELKRQKTLHEGNAGVLKNLQSAQATLKAYKAQEASLRRQLRLMGLKPTSLSAENLHSTIAIRSPISGVISTLYAQLGSYVDVSSPVAEVVDNSSLHLDLQVYEKDLPLVEVGQKIHFTLTNNPVHEYDAEIFSIGAAFEDESKSIPVHAKVEGDKSGLIDGMSVTAIVSLNNATLPAVPNSAIVEESRKHYIFVVVDKPEDAHIHNESTTGHQHSSGHEEGRDENADGEKISFKKIEVITGVSNMGYTSVTFIDEVSPDAQIVTHGAFFINAKMSDTGEAHAH